MFGISSAELVIIAFVAILVFGPERVPEFFHRAGQLIRGLQNTADDVWTSLQTELNEATEPIREAEREIKKLGSQIMGGSDAGGKPPKPAEERPAEERAAEEPPDEEQLDESDES